MVRPDKSRTLFRSASPELRLLPRIPTVVAFTVAMGVAFGFISVVLALVYAMRAPLPAGIVDQDYVTLGRRMADRDAFTDFFLRTVEEVPVLAPEVRWTHGKVFELPMWVSPPGGALQQAVAREVSTNYLRLFGVGAAAGHVSPPDDHLGRTAVLSYGLWKRLFPNADDVTGLQVSVQGGGEILPVLGVASPDFNGVLDEEVEIWILVPPVVRSPGVVVVENGYMMFGVLPQADYFAPLQSLLSGYEFETATAEHDSLELVRSIELHPDQRADTQRRLAWLLFLVLALVTMAFTTLAEYLLADHSVRREEQAVRMAVGATPSDVFRETLVRHGGLVLAMATAAMLFSVYAADVVIRPEPFSSYIGELGRDAHVVGIAGGVSLLILGFVLSAAYVSRLVSRTSRAIATMGARTFAMRSSRTMRRVLLATAAGSLLLVVSLVFTYATEARHSLGLAHPEVAALQVSGSTLSVEVLAGNAAVVSAARSEMPVLGATYIENLAFVGTRMRLRGQPGLEDVVFHRNRVSNLYFDTVGLELLAGSELTGVSDSEVVLSRSAAMRIAGDPTAAVGMVVEFVPDSNWWNAADPTVATVVGVVEDVAYSHAAERPMRVFYSAIPLGTPMGWWASFWYVRHTGPVDDIVAAVEDAVDDLNVHVTFLGTLAEVFRNQFIARRAVEAVLALSGAFAVALAFAGVSSSMARSISSERHDIAIHLAVGAANGDLVRRYLAQLLIDVLFATVALCGVVLAVRITTPRLGAVLDPWLLLAFVLPTLIGLCALLVFRLIARAGGAYSVNSLLQP